MRPIATIVKTSSGTLYVKGVGEGEATITAKYKGETAKIDIKTDEYITWVIPNKKYFEVVASSGDNSRYITLKALKKGTPKVYAITSAGDITTISITIK